MDRKNQKSVLTSVGLVLFFLVFVAEVFVGQQLQSQSAPAELKVPERLTTDPHETLSCPNFPFGPVGLRAEMLGDMALLVALSPTGDVYFAVDNCIFSLDAAGSVTRIAGGGKLPMWPSKPALATDTWFQLSSIAVGPDHNIYVVMSPNAIYEISKDGSFRPILPKPGLARQVEDTFGPNELVVDQAGALLIADSNMYLEDAKSHRIAKLDSEGHVSTVFDGSKLCTGGLSAVNPPRSISVHCPFGMAVDPHGSIYLADLETNQIAAVSVEGNVTTVVGGNNKIGLFSGDGGPARAARVWGPQNPRFDAEGNLYFRDSGNGRIRKVSPDGMIATALDLQCRLVDKKSHCELGSRGNFTVDGTGNIYLFDIDNHDLVKVSPSGQKTFLATILTTAVTAQ